MKKFLFITLFLVMTKNFAQQKEVYTDILISEKRQEKYEGIYKNGEPFSGYFKTEKMIDDIYFIDFYENGERKFRYYVDYFQDDLSLSNGIYNAKTEYENGKIKNGMDIKNMNNLLIWAEYKNFQKEKVHLDFFAVHYFNRISFELNGNTLKIIDAQAPNWRLEIKKIKNNPYELSVFQNDKLFFYVKEKDLKEVKFGTPNAVTCYYKNKKTNALEIKTYQSKKPNKEDIEKSRELHQNSRVLGHIYYTFSANKADSAEDLLGRVYENITESDFTQDFLFADKKEELELISILEFDEKGQIEYGGKITPNADGSYKLEVFGKEKKVYEKISLDEIKKIIDGGIVVD